MVGNNEDEIWPQGGKRDQRMCCGQENKKTNDTALSRDGLLKAWLRISESQQVVEREEARVSWWLK